MMATFINNPLFRDDDLTTMNRLSPLDMLASVAVKVYEFEHSFKPTLDVPTFEKKPFPFNLNVKPRTYGRPRSSPIDVHALLPCLHRKRKLKQLDDHEKSDSCELGFERAPKKLRLVIRLQPPELPVEYRQKITEMGGFDLKFVIERRLRKSDVNNNNSLKMPCNKCLVDFGETEEMLVNVYQLGNSLTETIMTFTRSRNKSCYVLGGCWDDIVEAHQLKKDDVVQLWSFWVDDQLTFALRRL